MGKIKNWKADFQSYYISDRVSKHLYLLSWDKEMDPPTSGNVSIAFG